MNFRPRHLLIRSLLPLAWKSQRTRILLEFADTELDSAWQSLYALERVSDPRLRSLLFGHAFEELYHSDLFLAEAHRGASGPPGRRCPTRKPLLEITSNAARQAVEFFAFLAIGESEIRRDFGVYSACIPDTRVQKLFRDIRRDEDNHAESSTAALRELAAGAGVSLAVIQVRHLASLAYKRYVSVMSRLGVLPTTLLLCASYAMFGGFFARQARERLLAGRSSQLELMRRQQASIEAALG